MESMQSLKEQFRRIGIIPVVVLNDAKDATPLGEALLKGGLPTAEVTFRTDAAEESIKIMAKECPELLLGAGTVLTCEQADRAVEAGAKFIVAPGLNPAVAEHCIKKVYPYAPGVQTPSEIEQALSFGLDFVKFFPAEPAGGLSMIKAIAAPYTSVTFMPTGGISTDNVCDYLAYDRIVCCGGTWMVKNALIEAGDFTKIEELTKEAAALVKKTHR